MRQIKLCDNPEISDNGLITPDSSVAAHSLAILTTTKLIYLCDKQLSKQK